eukprot:TRINITY_DN506_c0_g4_i1.p1 TRINITY_DN506_c0_g4~~TRINITY_DN506_c0_g4_i1.p1  ORF type:complete len:394 (-),score=80.62 TRINITY_DN506_c0_g4_i1:32-1213(-)
MNKREEVLLLFIIAVVVIGAPVWHYTTLVYRASLPFENISKWTNFQPLIEKYNSVIQTDSKALQPSLEYRLSFTLVNADPYTIIPSWDFPLITSTFLSPLLSNLSKLTDFTVDSQVLHFASLLKTPLFDSAQKSYYIPMKEISNYINPSEWKLDYSPGTTPTLNFIIFVPTKSQSPLHIRGSSSNSFIIPQFGGIIIHNVDHDTINNTGTHHLHLTPSDVSNDMVIFLSQLHTLIGIDAHPQSTTNTNTAHHFHNITTQQFDRLVEKFLSSHLDTTLSTLNSLQHLINTLSNMVVFDNIRDLVATSVNELQSAHDLLDHSSKSEDLLVALQHARRAKKASEAAFFDPHMLSLLYFPNEHKLAMYLPLFLPVFFPIVMGLRSERRNKNARARRL